MVIKALTIDTMILLPFNCHRVHALRLDILLQEYYLIGCIHDNYIVKYEVNLPDVLKFKLLYFEILWIVFVHSHDLPLSIKTDDDIVLMVKEAVLWKIQFLTFTLDLDTNRIVKNLTLVDIVHEVPICQSTVVVQVYKNSAL